MDHQTSRHCRCDCCTVVLLNICVKKHEVEKHDGRAVNFGAKVTHTKRDCMSRQIREGTLIRRCEKPILNSKAEWFQPPIYRIRNEIVQE